MIVGDDRVVDNQVEYTFNYGTFESWVTSKKELDIQFVPIFQRMFEEAAVNTVVFPCKASVEAFVEMMEQCGLEANTFLQDKRVVCMGKQTANAVDAAEFPVSGVLQRATKEEMVQYLARELVNL